VSRSANLVIYRGVVAGIWTVRAERLNIAWFTEFGRVPQTAVRREAAAVATFLDRPLEPTVELT
jgi:hypothetical protein